MAKDPVTLTLPFLTWPGFYALLVQLLVVLIAVLIWQAHKRSRWTQPEQFTKLLMPLAWALVPVWLFFLGATLWRLAQVLYGVDTGRLATGSLGLGALIAAFLGAPFVIYGTWLRHKTNRLEQEGHMTDRINKAVEQLGADKIVKRDGVEESVPNIEVRMGAILSLERIAQDSTIHDKGRDHVRVMEILCAYIRENSNARKPVNFPLPERNPPAKEATSQEPMKHLTSGAKSLNAKDQYLPETLARRWAKALPKPRADIQLALNVIGRRSPQQRQVEAAWPSTPNPNTIWPFDIPFPYMSDEPDRAAIVAFEKQLKVWLSKVRGYSGYRIDLGSGPIDFTLAA